MSMVAVIGVHTPKQVDSLQSATGMEIRVGKNGAYLAERGFGASLLDAYDQTDRDSWVGQMGEFPEVAA